MKFTIDSKLLAFTLLNSLPKTAEWSTFTSALINSVDPAKLTFDDLETRIVAEAGRLNPSGTPESGLIAKGKPRTRTRTGTRTGTETGTGKWCEHHQSATHDMPDCFSYKTWVKELRENKGKKWQGKKGEKSNVAETPPDTGTPQSALVTKAAVSQNLINRIHAYLSRELNSQKSYDIIIDSSATSHMTPHRKWFTTYRTLTPPTPVTLGDDSTVQATGIGTVTLHAKVAGKIHEFILSNVLFIPDFRITLISVKRLASAGLSTFFPGNTSHCIVYQGKQQVMTGKHLGNLYHADIVPLVPNEAAHTSININLLHRQMGHISMDRIQHMVKEGQLPGIDSLTGTPDFCEPCTVAKIKKLPFAHIEGPRTT